MSRDAEDDITVLIQALVSGENKAWGRFVDRFAPVIYGAILKTLRKGPHHPGEEADVAQDVFVKLCRNEFNLLLRYDSSRASLPTFLTVIATSTTIDHMRRRGSETVDIDAVPEHLASVGPDLREPLSIPKGLLSERQTVVLQLLYEHDLDVAEVAGKLRINAQTVRSTKHTAFVKLRKHFEDEE